MPTVHTVKKKWESGHLFVGFQIKLWGRSAWILPFAGIFPSVQAAILLRIPVCFIAGSTA